MLADASGLLHYRHRNCAAASQADSGVGTWWGVLAVAENADAVGFLFAEASESKPNDVVDGFTKLCDLSSLLISFICTSHGRRSRLY